MKFPISFEKLQRRGKEGKKMGEKKWGQRSKEGDDKEKGKRGGITPRAK